jgi:non-canonical purine NTP pyrophosphatase (RdgB/HAM1 family)
MQDVTFITGNERKAEYLAKYLGFKVRHAKLELDELQSLDLKTIVEHKVRQAYEKIKSPVLVEDVSLEFEALHGLPGPFIKFFIDRIPPEAICRLLDGTSRKAIARCMFGFYDGESMEFFEGSLTGTIADAPAGEKVFGFDTFFIPEGYSITRAQMNEDDDEKTYTRMKPFTQVKQFLNMKASA